MKPTIEVICRFGDEFKVSTIIEADSLKLTPAQLGERYLAAFNSTWAKLRQDEAKSRRPADHVPRP